MDAIFPARKRNSTGTYGALGHQLAGVKPRSPMSSLAADVDFQVRARGHYALHLCCKSYHDSVAGGSNTPALIARLVL